ncbi:histidine phosphatase family protein [Nocardioides nanhaiensis]|uniref:Histidine phosphatase family protein n=1 Tax=Nocardioides nanhaiensis TaxID=1476871 RepID=A0ABP8VPR8_9ACTN
MALVLLVRHGQASFGAADYDVLSETGWEQARTLGRWLAEQGLTATSLVRGGLRRHRDTLAGIVEGARWDDVETVVDERWDEFDHLGLMAHGPELAPGHTREEFQAVFAEVTAAWAAGAEHDYPETFAAFVDRVRAAQADAAARATEQPRGLVVVVTSGGPVGVSAALLTTPAAAAERDPAALGEPWAAFNTVVVNSSVTRLVVGSGGTRLLTFNEHTHLSAGLRTYR